MQVSVVIPARNAASMIGDCLDALADGSIRADEVIVVDDGSTDDTANVARAHGARVIQMQGVEPAAARNAGARVASGSILVFIDADCVPEPGCLEALLQAFDDPSVAGARGAYGTTQRSPVARFVQLELDEKQAVLAASAHISFVDTACAAYRRDVFWKHQGFDEHFPKSSVEDIDFSFRLVEAGERLVFVPGAVVRHRHPSRLSRYLYRKLRYGFFRVGVYRRFPQRLRGDGYTPQSMPWQIGTCGLVCLAAFGSPWLQAARPVALASIAAFLATSIPLTARAWKSDRGLAPLVPPLLFARSLAQGIGLALGLATMVFEWSKAGVRRSLDRVAQAAR